MDIHNELNTTFQRKDRQQETYDFVLDNYKEEVAALRGDIASAQDKILEDPALMRDIDKFIRSNDELGRVFENAQEFYQVFSSGKYTKEQGQVIDKIRTHFKDNQQFKDIKFAEGEIKRIDGKYGQLNRTEKGISETEFDRVAEYSKAITRDFGKPEDYTGYTKLTYEVIQANPRIKEAFSTIEAFHIATFRNPENLTSKQREAMVELRHEMDNRIFGEDGKAVFIKLSAPGQGGNFGGFVLPAEALQGLTPEQIGKALNLDYTGSKYYDDNGNFLIDKIDVNIVEIHSDDLDIPFSTEFDSHLISEHSKPEIAKGKKGFIAGVGNKKHLLMYNFPFSGSSFLPGMKVPGIAALPEASVKPGLEKSGDAVKVLKLSEFKRRLDQGESLLNDNFGATAATKYASPSESYQQMLDTSWQNAEQLTTYHPEPKTLEKLSQYATNTYGYEFSPDNKATVTRQILEDSKYLGLEAHIKIETKDKSEITGTLIGVDRKNRLIIEVNGRKRKFAINELQLKDLNLVNTGNGKTVSLQDFENLQLMKQPFRDMTYEQIYSNYSAAGEPNVLERSHEEYLGELADIAKGRPQGSSSDLQGKGAYYETFDAFDNSRKFGNAIDKVTTAYKENKLSPAAREETENNFFRFSRAGADKTQRIAERIYINANANHAPELMKHIVREIIDNPEKYPGVRMAKISGSGAVGGRAENIVIYVTDRQATEKVLQALEAYQAKNPEHFMDNIPQMTEGRLKGVAVGDEPLDRGTSFGGVRSQVIAEALLEAKQNSLSYEDFQQLVNTKLKQRGVNPEQPFRNIE